MARYTDTLLRNLRLAGVDVIEIEGWRTRGSSTFSPRGGVNHHTAGPKRGIAPSLGICINGRSDVPGPLCHGLLGRDNKMRLIASGRSNHAGKGGTRGLSGNSSVFGLEIEHTGVLATEAINWDQVDMAARIQAAFAVTGGYSAIKVVQHWEWTTRKIDFVKGGLDENWFRNKVDFYISYIKTGSGAPAPQPTPPKEEGVFMALSDTEQKEMLTKVRLIEQNMQKRAFAMRDPRDGRVWVFGDGGKWWVRNMDALNIMVWHGMVAGFGAAGIPMGTIAAIDGVPEVDQPSDVAELVALMATANA